MNELLDLAQSVAVQAGEYAAERRRAGVTVADTKSNDLDIVTAVDRDTESMIRDLIRQSRPNDAIFGEEGGAGVGTSGLTWVVDPIDGTVNFLYGIPQWAVSIAVVEGEADPSSWRVLAGAVCNPSLDELFSAAADGPADLNGREIRVNPITDLGQALVGTGFAYDRAEAVRQTEVLASFRDRIRDVRRMGAASLDLCSVACGRLDAYFEANTKPWDFAAGSLIAERAGARVGGLDGNPLGGAMVLAAAPEIFPQLDTLLSRGNSANVTAKPPA